MEIDKIRMEIGMGDGDSIRVPLVACDESLSLPKKSLVPVKAALTNPIGLDEPNTTDRWYE